MLRYLYVECPYNNTNVIPTAIFVHRHTEIQINRYNCSALIKEIFKKKKDSSGIHTKMYLTYTFREL